MKSKSSLRARVLAGSVAALLCQQSASAFTYYWDNLAGAGFGAAGGTWAGPTPGPIPGWTTDGTGAAAPASVTTATTDTVNFGNGATGLAAGTITVSGTVSTGNMTFAAGSGAITLSGAGSKINLGGSRTITSNYTAGVNVTRAITSELGLSGATTFTIGDTGAGGGTRQLTLGVLSGTGGTTFQYTGGNNGFGVVLLNAASTYTGTTLISTSLTNANTEVRLGVNDALPTGTVVTIGGVAGTGSGRKTTLNLNGKNQTLAGLATTGGGTDRTQDVFNASGTQSILTINDTGTRTFAGLIGNGGTNIRVDKGGAGNWTLSGANTYTGVTNINAGTITIASNAALGTTAGNTVIASGARVFVGTASLSTAEAFNIAGSGVGGTSGAINIGGSVTGVQFTGAITLSGDATIQGDGSTSTTFSGGINTAGFALTFKESGTIAVTSGITGVGGSVIKNTGGTLTLASNNSYTGATTVNAGTLSLTGSLIGGGAISTTGTGIVSQSAAGLIIGASSFTQGSSGTSVLAGANTYTGITTLTAGKLNLGAAESAGVSGPLGTQLANAAGTIVLGGGTLQYSAANQFDYSGRFSTAASQAYNVDTNSQNVTWATALTSSGGTLTKSGTGTLTLTGLNTYTGISTLTAGTLNLGVAETVGVSGPLGNSAASNPGSIVLGGGTLQYSAANQFDYSGRFSTAASQAYNVDTNAQDVTWATALTSSSGTLTKSGLGKLTLTGGNTHTGLTTINGGRLELTTGTTNTGAGSFTTGSAAGTRGMLLVGTGASITTTDMDFGSNATAAGAGYQTAGTVALTAADGSGVFGLGNANSGYGYYKMSGTALSMSRMTLVNTGTTGGTGIFHQTAGTTTVSTWIVSNHGGGNALLDIEGGTLLHTATANFGMSSVVNGYSVFNVRGTGTFNTNSPILVLRGSSGAATGTVGILNLLTGGTIQTAVGGITNGTTAGGSGLMLVNLNGGTLFTKVASTTLINFNNTNSVLTAASGAFVYSGGLTVDTNGFNSSIPAALQAPTGEGVSTIAVTSQGSGYIGAPLIKITGGTGVGATAVANMVDDGTGNGTYMIGTITLTNPGTGYANTDVLTLAFGDNTSVYTTQAVLGAVGFNGGNTSGGLTKTGAGVLTLTGANTYAGATTISDGILTFGTKAAKAAGTATAAASGSVGLGVHDTDAAYYSAADVDSLFNSNSLAGFSLNAASGVALDTTNAGGSFTQTIALTAPRALTKLGNGTLVLSQVNTYSGTTTISAGTVNANSTNALGDGSTTNTLIFNGGTLQAGGAIASPAARGVTMSSTGLIDTNGNAVDVAGAVTGAGGLTKLGTNTLTLTGLSATAASNYSGTTTINEGTLTLATTSPSLTGGLTFGATAGSTNTGTLDLSGVASSATFAGALLVQTNSVVANSVVIGVGKTLTVNGGLTMTNSTDGAETRLTMTGGGALVVNGPSMTVGSNAAGANISGEAHLDLSALGSFTSTLTGDLIIQAAGDNNAADPSSLTLSNVANTITAAAVRVGNSATGSPNTLWLGSGTNLIQTDLLNLGSGGRDSGIVDFAGSGGSVTLRNVAGTGRVAAVNLGVQTAQATGYTTANLLDLTGNTADIAINTFATSLGAKTAANTNDLLFDTGTLDIKTINMAVAKGTGSSINKITIGGGTVKLGGSAAFADAGTGTVTLATAGSGELIINGGSVTSTASLLKGAAGTGTATVTLNGGTLDMTGNNIGGATDTVVLAAQSGTLSNIGTINSTGGLTKTTAGTLVLAGTSAYTGGTAINGGTLQLDYTGSDTTKLSDSAVLTFGGGTLDLKAGTHTEVVASTTLATGTSGVTRSSGAAVLEMNAITPNLGAAISFGAPAIATTDNTNTNGILGAWATVGGTDWAINSTNLPDGLIIAYTGYTDVARQTAGTIADGAITNVRIVEGLGSNNITLGAATTTINTLNQSASGGTSAATIDPAGQTLSTGGILVGTGAGGLTIGTGVNNGFLSAATAGGDLILTNNTANGFTINSIIADNTTSALVKQGTGLLTLTGVNTYAGATNIGTGILNANSTDALGNGSATNTLIFTGGTLQAGGTIASPATRTVTLTSTGLIDTNGNPVSIAGVMSGAGGLTKSGADTLTLTGVNTYSGSTTIAAGTLNANSTDALGSATNTLIFTGGTLQAGGAITSPATRTVTLTSTGLIDTNGNPVSIASVMSGAGGLTKSGLGTLTLSGTNTYTGSTLISAGSLQLGATGTTGSLASTTGITNDAGLIVNRSNAFAQATDLNGQVIAGTGSFTQAGTGTTTLSLANTYSGATSITGGSIILSDLNAIQNSTSVSVASGTSLRFPIAGTYTTAGTISIVGTGLSSLPGNPTSVGALWFGTGGSYASTLNAPITLTAAATISSYGNVMTQTLGGAIGGTGPLTINSTGGTANDLGVWNLNAASNYTGDTIIRNGSGLKDITVKLGIANALPITTSLNMAGVANTANAFATLDLNGFGQELAGLTDSGSTSSSASFGKRVINSSGTLATLTINNAGAVTYGTTGTNVLAGTIGGTTAAGAAANNLALTKTGAGILTLTALNTFTGNIAITGGTLLSAAGSNSLNPTSSPLGNPQTASRTVTIGSTGTLSFGGNDALGNSLSVPVVKMINNGGLINNTGNFFTTLGPVDLNGGTINAVGGVNTNFGSFKFAGTVTVGGSAVSTISATGANSQMGLQSVTGTTFDVADAVVGSASDLNVSAVLANVNAVAGILIKDGAGTMTLSGLNTFTGNVLISNGTLVANATETASASPLGNASNTRTITVASGATLQLAQGKALKALFSSTNVPSLIINGTVNDTNLASPGNNPLGLVTLNNGTLTASVGNASGYGSYNLNDTVTSTGTSLISSTAIVPITLSAAAGTTTTFDVQSGTLTVSAALGEVTATGDERISALTKTSAGTLILSGANTYTGATTVSVGTLVAANAAALGSAVAGTTVTSGATLDVQATITAEAITVGGTGVSNGALITSTGTGTVGGAVTLSANTSLGGAGDLNINGAVTSSGGPFSLTKVGGGVTSFGPVGGGGSLAGVDDLTAQGGTTNVNSVLGGGTSDVSVTGATTKLRFGSVSQTLNSLTIGAGSTVIFTSGTASGAFSGGGGKGASLSGSAVVPEPGTIGLLLVGALGVLNRRRRQA